LEAQHVANKINSKKI